MAGAFNEFATGIGNTDAGFVMGTGRLLLKVPETMRFRLEGRLQAGVMAKDIILHIIGEIGFDGATYRAMQFDGSGVATLSMDDRMTMANMAIEAGGKAGLFAADARTLEYARAAGRTDPQPLAADPGAAYERVVAIDASAMSPRVACPHLPENVKPVAEVGEVPIRQAVIGSCTNGRIEDLREAAAVLQGRKAAPGVRLIVLPATPRIWRQAMAEGLFDIFLDAGAVIGPPTCGPCLGGHMGILAAGEVCVATTNRNFKGRMGSLESFVYLAGPAVAAASAVAGRIIHPGAL
jgi:3-isopropylmalate/(R)-2-methylmalate dehydratase large subunit